METTINNNQRVFQVITSTGTQFFCNLKDLNKICKDMNEGYFTIYYFWNNKPKKITKKHLKELFEAMRVKQTFIY